MHATSITPEEIDDLMPQVIALPTAEGQVVVQSLTLKFPFETARLAEFEPQIRALLDRSAPEFLETDGRGSKADRFPCVDSAVVGPRLEALIALGLAVGKIKWLAPRSTWPEVFPDGIPYLQVVAEPGQHVPPLSELCCLPPLPDSTDKLSRLNAVPWVSSRPARLYERAKKLVKIKVRHPKPKR
jgi:hypothetical protein